MGSEVVKANVIESLFGLGIGSKREDPVLAAKLAQLGISHRNAKDCPRANWMPALELTAKHVYPEVPVTEGMRRLGHDTVEAQVWGKLWGIMAKAAPVMGPDMMVNNAPKMLATGDNYSTVKVTKVADREYYLTVSGQPLPYAQGLIEGCLAATKAPGVQVQMIGQPVSGTGTFRVTWGKS